MEPLRTDRLVLREVGWEDEPALDAIFSDPSLFEYNDDGQPSPGEAHALIEQLTSDAEVRRDVPQPQFEYFIAVAQYGGPLFGYVTLNVTPGSRPDIGIVLARDYHGQGYADEAVRKVRDFAFQLPGVDHVDAKCRIENERSMNLFSVRLGGVPIDVEGGSRWYRLSAD